MENHPIPQNVTGFQFRLIGDMTVKQFAYLASGCVIAGIILFATPFNFILIKFPSLVFWGGMGAAFAFLPIGGRPLDSMLMNFIKAVITPNQYVFQKIGGQLNLPEISQKTVQTHKIISANTTRQTKNLEAYLNRLPHKPQNQLDEKENVFLQSVFSLQGVTAAKNPVLNIQSHFVSTPQVVSEPSMPQPVTAAPVIQPPIVRPPLPEQPRIISSFTEPEKHDEIKQQTMQPEGKEEKPEETVEEVKEKLDEKTTTLQKELEEAKQNESHQTSQVSVSEAHQKVLDLEKQLQESLVLKEQLEKQLAELSQKLQNQTPQVKFAPSALPKAETPNVHTVPRSMAVKVGLPFVPDVPNLITGIIKDSRGNILTNILVEVLDKEENPIRAFKTNNLGQFASATPLLNGVYTLVFEDPAKEHKFDNVEITANGQIIPPLEIISIDAREELRKELFG